MNRYFLDSEAKRDLDGIYKRIARDNRTAAAGLIRAIKAKFALLASQPFMGQTMPDLAPDLRSFVHGNYLILYRPGKQGIEVARVIHTSRDLGTAYFEDQP